MPISADAILNRFRGKLSSDDLSELQEALHQVEEQLTANVAGDQAGPPRFRGMPMPGGGMATDPGDPASEAQRRAMHAAASGKSTLGIPQGVGKELTEEWGEGHDDGRGMGRWGGRARMPSHP
jgi:hypothetical protein